MTNAEIKFEFDLRLKAIAPIRYELFDTVEISALLTKSQLNLVKQYASIMDAVELARKLGGNLIKPAIITVDPRVGDNLPNGQFLTLPLDILSVYEEHVQHKDVENEKPIRVKPITYDEYLINRDNPFKRPYADLFWRLDFYGKKHEIITDGTLASIYTMRYLCIPVAVNLDNPAAGLSVYPAFHPEVVDGAVKLALQIIQIKLGIAQSAQPAQGKQTSDNDNNQN